MEGFIVLAKDAQGKEVYVSNTSPILWTDKLEEAKISPTKRSAIISIEDDFIVLSNCIVYSDLQSIEIVEYKDNIEIGRDKYL